MGQSHSRSAIGAYSRQHPGQETEHDIPDKTAGGALGAGAGYGVAGYTMGAAMAKGGMAGAKAGPWGAAIGAGVGLLGYFLS